MNNELYLKTAFCCTSCDGNIANEEIQLIKQYVENSTIFQGLEVEKLLNEYIKEINKTGIEFLKSFILELTNESKTKEEELKIVKIAIEVIETDNEIQYSEIKFFKKIRGTLNVNDEDILKEFPGKEDYLLPDIATEKYEFLQPAEFSSISLNITNIH